MSHLGHLLGSTDQQQQSPQQSAHRSEGFPIFAEPTEITHDYFPHFESMAGMAGSDDYQTKLQESAFFESQQDYMSFNHPHLPPCDLQSQHSGHRDPYNPDAYQIHNLVHPDENNHDQLFYHPMSNSVYNINEHGEEEYLDDTFTPSFSVEVKPKRKYLKRHQAGSLESIDSLMSTGSNSRDDSERKRRAQVKVACIHCKKACKKCDDVRPCGRCVRIGFANNCLDAPRKERKKGFKRGPYNKGRRDSMESIGDSQDWSPVDSGSETTRSYEQPKFMEHQLNDAHLEQQMVVAHDTDANGAFNNQEEILYIQQHQKYNSGADDGHHHHQQHDQSHDAPFYHQFPAYLDEAGVGSPIDSNNVSGRTQNSTDHPDHHHQEEEFDNHYYPSDLPVASGYFFPATGQHHDSDIIGPGDSGESKRRSSLTVVDHRLEEQFVSPMSIFGSDHQS